MLVEMDHVFHVGGHDEPKPFKPPPSFVVHLSNSVNFIL